MKTIAIIIFSGLLLLAPTASARVLEDKNCGSCHRLKAKETKKSFTGPDLHYAGNKFQPEWLKKYLKNPEVIRPAGFVTDLGYIKITDLPRHISYSEEEAYTLTQELMALKVSSPTFVAPAPLSKGLRARIKYQFERTFGCISCHQSLNLAGKVRGGISGPSLVNAGNRLQAAWVADWLKASQTYTAKGRMPRYKMEPVTLGQFTQFLMTLKKENIK